MIKLYFGLPGAGKTTTMVANLLRDVKDKRIKNVYCNVHTAVPGVTYIDNECIGEYELSDGVLHIDEASLFADNRAYKSFDRKKMEFFLLHRHKRLLICLYTQQWDALDRKIRVITDEVYYVHKGKVLGKWFTNYYRIPYGIIIPDPKDNNGGEKLGEIVQGYCKPGLLKRIFCRRMYRPRYYKYFDSWECDPLPPLPEKYMPYRSDKHTRERTFRHHLPKTRFFPIGRAVPRTCAHGATRGRSRRVSPTMQKLAD